MKNLHSVILTLALSVSGILSAFAETNTNTTNTNNDNNNAATYYIDAPRFVRPIIEKWITEYQKVQPNTHFAIAKTAANREQSALHVALSDSKSKAGEQKTVFFAQYAILPVTAKNSDAAKLLGDNELSSKKIKSLFFQGDEFDEADAKKNKKFEQLVVYTGNSNLSVSQEFASHYGQDATTFRGKRIVGDDQFLNNAIAKDPKGVTINALANIYDLQTRQLKSNLSLLPLDVDKNVQAALTENATLDQLLNTLETFGSKDIPVEAVGLSYDKDNAAVEDFVNWVISEGKTYNHEYGLLNLNKDFAQR